MSYSIDIQTLIWLFPIMFILHDFEEIIMIEKWINKNSTILYTRLPEKIADRVMKQFSMSTVQFAVAVVVIFMFVSSSTFIASQYVNQGPFGDIYFFTIVTLVYFLHAFTHLAQAVFFRSITPGAFTSLIIVIPYSLILYYSLLVQNVITWNIIFVCLPFCLLIIPVVLLAHWIGRKVI
ncbi:HXXEE domain-containing protein [Lysinibacillus sp. NPDC097231]|uniref:HXXEE domain-containing protein n=1 Tax=Lysinibacillus sp. NPDC097231 TaxID=3364142 RepID=UPI0037FF1C7A